MRNLFQLVAKEKIIQFICESRGEKEGLMGRLNEVLEEWKSKMISRF